MGDDIRFTDGAAYERYMGVWSQLVGRAFLDWLAPAPGRRWLDVGCGSGAFTGLVLERCAPASVDGIDPSAPQLEYARTRAAGRARFHRGEAQALPFPNDAFDVAVMPLVIFFVPDPADGVAEMARVVAPGGSVAAYAWDMDGGGFPYATLRAVMQELGMTTRRPPSPDASRLDSLHALWTAAGLEDVAVTRIGVERSFASFEDYWTTILGSPSVGPTIAAAMPGERQALARTLRERLPVGADGRITSGAIANAVSGRVAGRMHAAVRET